MTELQDSLVLYHGSYCAVENPDLAKCALYKDFGQGFYLTTSKEQAKSFAKLSAYKRQKAKAFDVISGKIANDDTNTTIMAYMSNLYGKMGTEIADKMCISLLLPERLKDQFCFRTQKALSKLRFVKVEKVALE